MRYSVVVLTFPGHNTLFLCSLVALAVERE